ncbi:hypothetical protein AK812_SmicGene42106 [Symbiodinium microadriaticum]|uniref:Uncharacterized protein n=1 Tax=Symbiodinium microadriaticum TaxID=2951 RepID=A0A1Q9C4F4_SYMMI|nr:hypothetical protein AK812_SmicGene42106 [Symbiodinium microadriaticum]
MATAVQQLRVPPVQLKPAWFTSPEAAVRLPTDIARDRLGGAPSRFYHYPDPVEGVGNISEETRKPAGSTLNKHNPRLSSTTESAKESLVKMPPFLGAV